MIDKVKQSFYTYPKLNTIEYYPVWHEEDIDLKNPNMYCGMHFSRYANVYWRKYYKQRYHNVLPYKKKKSKNSTCIEFGSYKERVESFYNLNGWARPIQSLDQIVEYQNIFFEIIEGDFLQTLLSIRNFGDLQFFWKFELFTDDNEYSSYFIMFLFWVICGYIHYWFEQQEYIWDYENSNDGTISPIFKFILKYQVLYLEQGGDNKKKSEPIALDITMLICLTYLYWLDPSFDEGDFDDELADAMEADKREVLLQDWSWWASDNFCRWCLEHWEEIEEEPPLKQLTPEFIDAHTSTDIVMLDMPNFYGFSVKELAFFLRDVFWEEMNDAHEQAAVYHAYAQEYESLLRAQMYTAIPGVEIDYRGGFLSLTGQRPWRPYERTSAWTDYHSILYSDFGMIYPSYFYQQNVHATPDVELMTNLVELDSFAWTYWFWDQSPEPITMESFEPYISYFYMGPFCAYPERMDWILADRDTFAGYSDMSHCDMLDLQHMISPFQKFDEPLNPIDQYPLGDFMAHEFMTNAYIDITPKSCIYPVLPYDLYVRRNYALLYDGYFAQEFPKVTTPERQIEGFDIDWVYDMGDLDVKTIQQMLLKGECLPNQWILGRPGHKYVDKNGDLYGRLVTNSDAVFADKEFIAWLDSYTLDPTKRYSNYEVILRGPITARIKRYCIYGF